MLPPYIQLGESAGFPIYKKQVVRSHAQLRTAAHIDSERYLLRSFWGISRVPLFLSKKLLRGLFLLQMAGILIYVWNLQLILADTVSISMGEVMPFSNEQSSIGVN